jgi:hypothetical protein
MTSIRINVTSPSGATIEVEVHRSAPAAGDTCGASSNITGDTVGDIKRNVIASFDDPLLTLENVRMVHAGCVLSDERVMCSHSTIQEGTTVRLIVQ